MEDSLKSTGSEKSITNAKNDPKKVSKKKRKQGKKFRAKFNEGGDDKSQECSTMMPDEQTVEANQEDCKKNVEGNDQVSATNEGTEEKASPGEASASHSGEQLATAGASAVPENINEEESINKNQEASAERRKSELEQTKQDLTDGIKKGKRSSFNLLRSKRNAKNRLSSGEVTRTEDLTDEYGIWAGESEKIAGQEDERNIQQADGKDGAKIEKAAKSAEVKGKEAEKSPEGLQDKSQNKGNKSKKIKHLPSFGRSKKKADITNKNTEVEVPETEVQESKRDSIRGEVSENTLDESNEPVLVDFRHSSAVAEGEKKGAGTSKRKKAFPTLKRNKNQAKKRKSSTSEDEPNRMTNESEINSHSKQNDDVSATDSAHVETEGAVEIEEKSSENKKELSIKETKDAVLHAKGTSETKEVGVDKESSTPEEKEQEATVAEETGQVSTKKNKKSGIFHSFKKLTSQNKTQQGTKKPLEKEQSLKTNDEDSGDKAKEETTTETEEKTEGISEECSHDEEGSPKAVKRKTSDLKNVGLTQAQKRKKEDGENFIEDTSDVKENDEAVEEQKITPLGDDGNELNLQTNEELPQQNNDEQELTEKKEEEENSRESPALDDARDEEIWNEAHELRSTLMKTVKDFNETKETERDQENGTQVDKTTVLETTSGSEGALPGSQMEAGVVNAHEAETCTDRQDMEQDIEDESYDSAITVVSVEQLRSQDIKIENEDTPLNEEGVSAAIDTPQATVPRAEETEESSETEPSDILEPKTEGTKEHSDIENSQVTGRHDEGEELKTDDPRESVKQMEREEPQIESEVPLLNDDIISSKTETSPVSQAEEITKPKAENPEVSQNPGKNQLMELQVQQTIEQKTEDAEAQTETEISQVVQSLKEETEQKIAEAEDPLAGDIPPPVMESQVEQENTVDTKVTEEMRAFEDEAVSGSEVDGPEVRNKTESRDVAAEETQISDEKPLKIQNLQKADSKAEDRKEPKAENSEDSSETVKSRVVLSLKSDAEYNAEQKKSGTEEKRAIDEESSPEKVVSEPSNKNKKIDKLLQRRMVESLLTEPENSKKNADEEVITQLDEKKEKKFDKEKWVMVQHFEMTDEVVRQLGHMLTLNAFKRTTKCCTIM